MKIVECVPNFSEGRDRRVIDAIAAAIAGSPGVRLLDVDPGADTNRTVMTFVGPPEAMVGAAFAAIACAAETIDMRRHKGAHPRQGATDVCPFVPVADVTMEECVSLAQALGQRVGDELGIPVYLYEHAATRPERKSLPDIRQGEYEALAEKLRRPEWAPDFGPAELGERQARSGATVIGARKFLIAYNINLNSRRTDLAKDIALNIRERGRLLRDEAGAFVRDEAGKRRRRPGDFRECKATGWYLPAFHRAQVTMNLTDWEVTPPHAVFDEVARQADERGVRATGSELVGLIPLAALRAAGRHYLAKQGVSTGAPDEDLVRVAVQSLGLEELGPFDPRKKVIEYAFAAGRERLVDKTVAGFADELSRDSPAPGGGSVAALAGALGAALAAMVANLTHRKKGYEAQWDAMDRVAARGQDLKAKLLHAVDEDTAAFTRLMDAFALPKETPEEKKKRGKAIREATRGATLVPLAVLETAADVIALADEVVRDGNQNSLSDGGVAALMGRTCAQGAYYNVLINLKGISDEVFVSEHRARADAALAKAVAAAEAVHAEVAARLQA